MRNKERSTSEQANYHRLLAAEMFLIRAGQHLFKEWRAKGRSDNNLEESFEAIWQLKREIRRELERSRIKLLRPAKVRRSRRIL